MEFSIRIPNETLIFISNKIHPSGSDMINCVRPSVSKFKYSAVFKLVL